VSEAATGATRFPGVRDAVVAVGIVAVVTGTAIRAVHFAFRRSLWLDEAMLALNVATRSFRELLTPLDYDQTAPILFLWLERAIVMVAGVGEAALRVPSFVGGVALLVVLWHVGDALFGRPAGAIAAAMAAGSPTLVRYANEAKPYGTDALTTVVMLAMALAVHRAPTRARWALLALTGVLGVTLSFPALFVAGGAVAWGLAVSWPERRRRWPPWAACGAAWLAAALLPYALLYERAAANPHQQQGYEAAFLAPGTIDAGRLSLAWRGIVLPTFVGNGSAIPTTGNAGVALLTLGLTLGMVAAARIAGKAVAIVLAGPLVLALAASALRRYPIGVPRMMAFAAPLLVLMAAAGLAAVARWARARWGHAPVAIVVMASVPSLALRAGEARTPFAGEDARTLVQAFRERPRRGEPVYVNARGLPSWLFYTTNWDKPDDARLSFYARAARTRVFENAPPRPGPVVAGEGFDLVYAVRGRKEILGLPTGRQWRWPSYVKSAPDEGWAENEAERVVREADPCAWLYFTRMSERAYTPMTSSLKHRGAKEHTRIGVPGGVLARFCLPYTPEQIAALEAWRRSIGETDDDDP